MFMRALVLGSQRVYGSLRFRGLVNLGCRV